MMNRFPSSDLTSWVSGDQWPLDPGVVQLNHGSFGACPRPVLQRQHELRQQMEAQPVRFLVRELPELLAPSRAALAGLIGAETENLVFVANATAGINAVLRSLRFAPGDEVLVTNHGYNACGNVARYVADRSGATVVIAEIPIPVESPGEIVEAVLARVTERTRLALLDHVTSPTAIVLPIADLIARLAERGVDTLVDGAHAPGMVPLDVKRLGAAYYAGNCHKWLCAPKSVGFLYVRPDRQEGLQPPVISHGYNWPRPGYTRFHDAFDWPGTFDPTPWLCVGEAIEFLNRLTTGGIGWLMRRNRELALAAREVLCEGTAAGPVCPAEMLGSMAAVILPDGAAAPSPNGSAWPTQRTQLGCRLLDDHRIEVPVFYWPSAPQSVLRVSAHAYNSLDQYALLREALSGLFAQS